MGDLLIADRLTKRFGGFTAVDQVSLAVPRGEVLGFLGPNGAGKTTTMKMLTGFLAPTSGSASICGLNVEAGDAQARRHIGYLPEGAPLYGDMTPRGFLAFIGACHGLKGDELDVRCRDAAAAVSLDRVLDQRIDTLSKGFRRRVGLAAAILHGPEVLILDEPTDGLDPNQKHDVRLLIEQLAQDRAIIISTHILEEVDALCSRAVVIDRGQVVADGTPSELRSKSRYKGAVVMILPDDQADAARKTLGDLPAVSDIELLHEGNSARLTVVPQSGRSISDLIGDTVAQNGWAVSEFYVDGGRLDDVFRTLTGAGRATP